MKSINFIKIALRDYQKIGALTLSSKHTIKRVLKGLKPEYKYIIEYGAGNGIVTREILNILPRDGRVVAIETNADLFKELSEIKDSRLIAMHADVTEIAKNFSSLGLPKIDAVISNIPASFLKPSERKLLIENTHKGLVDGGRFIFYQYSPLILPTLKRMFKKVSYSLEIINFPPYFVMIAEK